MRHMPNEEVVDWDGEIGGAHCRGGSERDRVCQRTHFRGVASDGDSDFWECQNERKMGRMD